MADRFLDSQVLDALHDCSGGSEFVEAGTVANRLRNDPDYRWPQDKTSAVGIGLRLSRLERSSLCDGKVGDDGAHRVYRSFPR